MQIGTLREGGSFPPRTKVWQDIADAPDTSARSSGSDSPVTPITADLFAAHDVQVHDTSAAPTTNPKRRSRGLAIAIALLALMVLFGAWYAVRAVQKVQPDTPAEARP
jgi:hypothetical protein